MKPIRNNSSHIRCGLLIYSSAIAVLSFHLHGQQLYGQRNIALQERLDTTVREYGEIENADRIEIRSPIKTSINWLLPEGTRVRKGDLVARLDTSILENNLQKQKIDYANANAASLKARVATEILQRRRKSRINAADKSLAVAKLALNNFTAKGGIAMSEINLVESQVASAQAKLELLSAIREQATAMVAVQIVDAKMAVTAAKQKLKTLKELNHPLQQAELEAEVAQRQADFDEIDLTFELEIKASEAEVSSQLENLKMEEMKLKRLQQQLSACSIRAPESGLVTWAQTRRTIIEEGAQVRELQTIGSIVDGEHFQVRVLVNESKIGKVRIGQEVEVSVDALPSKKLVGQIESISRFPEPSNFLNNDVKKYGVIVKLSESAKELRHGMSAIAEIKVK